MYDKINIILNKGTDINITWQEFIVNQRFDKLRKVVKLSDYVMRQQGKLLGHVIRANKNDPMRLPTITDNLETPGVYTKRVGRPRLAWVKENCKWTAANTLHIPWDSDDENGSAAAIIEQAIARKF